MFIAYRSNSREEVEKQRKIFLKLDKKKNGYVTYDEISILLSPHLDDNIIKKIFSSMDIDENGKIYWNEFLAATISQAIFLKEENLKEAFNNFD
jgi:Ca2+-binding EF-hand superfamily protein